MWDGKIRLWQSFKEMSAGSCGRPHTSHRCRISAGADPQATTMGLFVPSPSLVTLSAACQEQKYSTHKEGPLPPAHAGKFQGSTGPGAWPAPLQRGARPCSEGRRPRAAGDCKGRLPPALPPTPRTARLSLSR